MTFVTISSVVAPFKHSQEAHDHAKQPNQEKALLLLGNHSHKLHSHLSSGDECYCLCSQLSSVLGCQRSCSKPHIISPDYQVVHDQTSPFKIVSTLHADHCSF